MKQNKIFWLRLCAFLCLGWVHVASAQIAGPPSCFYAIDANLQKICLTPDTLAEPVDGLKELMHRLAVEVSQPPLDSLETLGSKTVIRFLIDESGHITGKLVLDEQFPESNVADQMFQIVEAMIWKPGYCDGTAVPTEFILPLKVYLN